MSDDSQSSSQSKAALLAAVQDGLHNHVITDDDLRALLPALPVGQVGQVNPISQVSQPANLAQVAINGATAGHAKKLSIVDVLFYLAGLVLYISLMVLTFQSGSDQPGMQIGVTLGSGLLLWTLVYILGREPGQSESDTRQGLINALMLTGCLAVVTGGMTAAYYVVGTDAATNGNNPAFAYAVAVALAILGAAHLAYDRILRHIILVVLGFLLICAAFPTVFIALLMGGDVPADVWIMIGIATGLLIAGAGWLAAKTAPGREAVKNGFLSLAGFIVLGSMYAGNYASTVPVIWEIILPLTIYLAFFISIKRKSKNFLITGSFYMVLFLVGISFKYFSGLGAAFSLMLSAASLLGTALLATRINKRYIAGS